MEETALVEKLKAMLKDECEGVKLYSNLASTVEQSHPDTNYSEILRKIATDEYNHRNCIMRILDEIKGFMPADYKTLWKESEDHYKAIRS